MLRLTGKHLCKFGVCSIEYQMLRLLRRIPLYPSLQQTRNTAILKRRNPVYPFKMDKYDHNKKITDDEFCIYDIIEETNCNDPKPIEVILTQPVEDLGLPGDIVEVLPPYARDHLLLPGIAVYASPENREKYAGLRSQHSFDIPSSRFAQKTLRWLEAKVFLVCMNLDTPWQIEPWQVRISFRREGIALPEHALALPSQPITGPDMKLEGKEFLVKVKINNKEEAKVRARVHHVSKVPNSSREPEMREEFHRYRAEPIFEDEAEVLAELSNRDPEMREED